MSATSLTLYDLSRELVELMDFWDGEDTTPEERAEVEQQLRIYAAAHVRKVDNVRAYLKHCELMIDGARREIATQKAHEEAWEARRDRLKSLCVDVMQEFQSKRLDGNTGSLLLKGNGGKQPVTIANPELVPDEFCVFEGAIPAFIWKPLVGLARELAHMAPGGPNSELVRDLDGLKLVRTPRKSLIEAELQKPCPECVGAAAVLGVSETQGCSACRGSGKRGVPGCTLEPRGVHLEVK